MPASTIVYKGHTTSVPGARSQTYADTVGGKGPTQRGGMAMVGKIRSLAPGVVHRINSAGVLKRVMASCEFRKACELAFDPTDDTRIPGKGAAWLYVVAANSLTQATRDFAGSVAGHGLTLKSARWGAEGNRVSVKIETGGSGAPRKKLTISRDGTSYVYDDLGGDPALTVQYTASGAGAYDAVALNVVRGSAGYVQVRSTFNALPVALYTADASKTAWDGIITLTPSAGQAADEDVLITGTVNGVADTETVTLAAGSTAAVSTTKSFDSLTSIDLSGLDAGTTVQVECDAARALFASHPTVQNVYDYLVGKLVGHGFTVSTALTDRATYLGEKLDQVSGEDPKAAAVSLYSLLDRIVTSLNADASDVVEASELGTYGGAPSNTGTDPLYLAGGDDNDSSADATAYEDALKLTRDLEGVTALWVQDNSAGVHAKVASHVTAMDDENERFAFLGAAAGETKAQLKTRVGALNNYQITLWFQKPSTYFAGVDTEFSEPYMLAAIMGGMFCGRPIGRALMRKVPRLTGVDQSSTISLLDDADELIRAGLCFIAPNLKQRSQLQVVRDVTTYMQADVDQFTSLSASESVAESKRDLREFLDGIIGEENFEGTAETVRGLAAGRLRRQATRGDALFRIRAWRNIVVEDLGDQYLVTYECNPIETITFVIVNQYVSRFAVSA